MNRGNHDGHALSGYNHRSAVGRWYSLHAIRDGRLQAQGFADNRLEVRQLCKPIARNLNIKCCASCSIVKLCSEACVRLGLRDQEKGRARERSACSV